MAWFKKFAEPIALDDGSKLLTFRDAAKYVRALPQAELEAAQWKVAIERPSNEFGDKPGRFGLRPRAQPSTASPRRCS